MSSVILSKDKESKKAPKERRKQLTVTTTVRRSTRKCSSLVKKEITEDYREMIREGKVADGLKVTEFKDKGRGVVATKHLLRGHYVCEYAGTLHSKDEATVKEKEYEVDDAVGCYMYYFNFKGKDYCVDATKEDKTLGRLINHSRTKSNVKTRAIEVDGAPRLFFIATGDIKPDTELLYDYGDHSKQSHTSFPWLKL